MSKGQEKLSNAKKLWKEMRNSVSPFPKDLVVDVRMPIPGTAFFPGGYGLWLGEDSPAPDIPTGQIMIVGQDFNSVRIHEEALLNGTEVGDSPGPTWRELLKTMKATGLSVNQCFFTNLYMGLRAQGSSETGAFPGAIGRKDKELVEQIAAFKKRCVKFFERQLEMVQPKLIFVLGPEPFKGLAELFDRPAPSALYLSIDIYRSVPLKHGKTTIVLLTHPSMCPTNHASKNYYREYDGLKGRAAEEKMIADGLESSGIKTVKLDR